RKFSARTNSRKSRISLIYSPWDRTAIIGSYWKKKKGIRKIKPNCLQERSTAGKSFLQGKSRNGWSKTSCKITSRAAVGLEAKLKSSRASVSRRIFPSETKSLLPIG